VPVHNAEATLGTLVQRLLEELAPSGAAYEIILVNDGSLDGSWREIQDLSREHPAVRGIDLLRNFGQHNALLCGIRAARHEILVTLDDDLQHPPEEIPKLLARLRDGADVVYGVASIERHGILRDFASRSTKWVLERLMGAEGARSVSAFRAFRTDLRRAFRTYDGPFVSVDVLLTWGTRHFDAVTVEHAPRQAGRSSYTLRKLVSHTFNMVTGFSVLPLQIASWIGFLFTLFGGVVLAVVLVRYLVSGAVVPGFAFLASIIAVFSGAQLFAVGMLGEYLARMHFRLMGRPGYAVRGTTDELAPNGSPAP
jgi:undecaprenyl-phosphate 4-deoxy-4-formamido-L-arabinose transferase